MHTVHETYMQRAIALAKKSTRLAYPNPCVGAVIVCDGKIIGEGYTDAYGGHHAEVNAINAVQNQDLLPNATLYVTLEPCAHYGKTPPCARLIEAKKIPKIYIGCVDTSAEVSGKGIDVLLRAGCEIHVGVLEDICMDVHKRFLTFHRKKRPYIVLKWAETKDGFIDVERENIALQDAKPTWISNELSRQKVHQLRAEEHAIMVGTHTALKDNPSLTVRTFGGPSPIRVLIDKNLRIPTDYQLYDEKIKTIVFTNQQTTGHYNHMSFKKIDFSKNIIPQILLALHQEKIQSVIIEGGKQLLESFINQNVWDEAFVFVGNKYFKKGIKSPSMASKVNTIKHIGSDILKHYIF